ncbi:MAG: bifunctional tRNA (adenosine(37)-C2)-methyltransferase TrmG/ribosomal RNA large subunit methyltransferase RlmN, partial [Gammaproteobacteria bacterium]
MAPAPVTNLMDLDRDGLVEFFTARGEKAFRAGQVMQWIYGQGVTDYH